jgi:selenocysteine-specific elongation factor
MKPVILGTAGHIDHGKTLLVKTLTGIDTDRLKEEKLRGITIELGFAALKLPTGQRLGIVDVPGHEKFVKHMVAGATGVDMVALIIAADEGIMPQTREHLDICQLLRVKKGLVVLTKIDLVEKDWLDLVKEEIIESLKGSFLEGAPIVAVSSMTKEGIPELFSVLDALCAEIQERTAKGTFRLNIDRVFTMRGFGTVVTGSTISGSIRVGDAVMIYPKKIKAKVRGLQVHNEEVQEALAGFRTAVNLMGVEKENIERGDILAPAGALEPTYRVDAYLEHLKSAPRSLKNRARVRFHSGTSEIISEVVLLDADALKPGDAGYAYFRLDKPTVLLPEDRYVIRSYSPIFTIGGGEVLNPFPRRHKRFNKEVLSSLEILRNGSQRDKILFHIKNKGYSGISFPQLVMRINMTSDDLKTLLKDLSDEEVIVSYDTDQLIYQESFSSLKEEASKVISNYHKENPLKFGLSKEEMRSKLPVRINARLFDSIVSELVRSKEVVQEKEFLRLKDHVISLGEDQKAIQNRIQRTYLSRGLSVPFMKEVLSSLPKGAATQSILELMVKDGTLIRVKEDLYFHREVIEKLKKDVANFLKEKGEMNPSQFKELTGTSRKYAIPLMEYLDSVKLTIRIGDKRKLRAKK